MSVGDYSAVYEILDPEPREDLQELEKLVEDSVELKRSMTSASLPEGFEAETFQDGHFGFEASKSYEDGTEISLEYGERSRSFSRPDSSSVEIEVKMPYTITEHWDQRM